MGKVRPKRFNDENYAAEWLDYSGAGGSSTQVAQQG